MNDLLIHSRTEGQIENFIYSPAHALGINGQKGAGKSEIARYIIAKLIGEKKEKVAGHPYVFIINTEEQKAGIEEVRKLREFLALTVPGEKIIKRAVLIEGLDQLGHEAQNALLKTIEEPPIDTIIFATFSLKGEVLPTLHSRMRHIEVHPIDYETAIDFYAEEFNKDLVSKAYYMSGGLAGLLSALLSEPGSHKLITAINSAKELLAMSRYERLAAADNILKNKDVLPESLLDGLYRIVDAGFKQASSSGEIPPKELHRYLDRMKHLNEAISDLQQNVQAKLVISRLLLRL